MNKILYPIILLCTMAQGLHAQTEPLRIGVVGLTHTHVHWIFNSEKRGEIEIVGVVEPNRALARRYAEQYEFSLEDVFDSIDDLLDAKQPVAVTAFGTIYDHLTVVQKCAPRGVHVMVEKPLAVSLEHARMMKELAQEHKIHLLTNYETTWYPTSYKAYQLAKKEVILGDIRKVIIRDGHRGPKKIGIDQEFLEWLTDPKLNGGGAIMDFGCYGANLMTWIMDGERPLQVTAITQQLQGENNPEVDDEAIIILTYKHSNALIQASWNWPIGRKDLEIHGLKGVIIADNRHDLRVRMAQGYDGFAEEIFKLEEKNAPFDDPFAYMAALIKGQINPKPLNPTSLENNMIVMEILDAALRSAKTGRTIHLAK